MATRKLTLGLLAALACAAPSTTIAKSERIALSKMTGKWSGSGWGKRHADAPRETLRCRLTSRYIARKRELRLTGKCAAAARSYDISGFLKNAAGGRVTGRWANPNGAGAVNIAGKRSGNSISFTVKATDPKTKQKRTYRMVWKLARGSMSVATRLADSETKPVGMIRFDKR